MDTAAKYNGALTAEQFLFFEMRIVSRMHCEGASLEEIIDAAKRGNLFQYPTERKIARMARACHRRLLALGSKKLIRAMATAPAPTAKQINLYAMMRHYRLVREFMMDVVGEKYRTLDFSCTKMDINLFFSRLQEQDHDVAEWSDKTISKLKSVLKKCLVETSMLDDARSAKLNPVLISAELERGIRENHDLAALAAFNCFK